ncbi:MAG: fibrobacter succinogenes major paralogous domain-containing protein, partial [Prevotellaceae bacterium]|nr:fibrobacter succinogenes major paralogous domain-containing protein [Prevotellaceae bacterium]
GAANSANCKVNHGRSASSGTAIGGRGICPPNWHVPTDYELGQLMDAMESGGGTVHQTTSVNGSFIGTDAGTRGKASCSGTSGDTNPVWDSGAGTDVFNFHGIASDDRNASGTNDGARGLSAIFWSSAAYSESYAWRRYFYYTNTGVYRSAITRSHGRSVRCVRDA